MHYSSVVQVLVISTTLRKGTVSTALTVDMSAVTKDTVAKDAFFIFEIFKINKVKIGFCLFKLVQQKTTGSRCGKRLTNFDFLRGSEKG